MYVIKKDHTHEAWNVQKVVVAVNKSAYRAMVKFTQEELDFICSFVEEKARSLGREGIPIAEMHNIVEAALEQVKPEVAKSYRDYRNYKQDFVKMLDEVYKKSQSIMYIGDKENSNSDSALVSTKRSLIYNQLNKELYQKFFMTTEELQACRDGYIYIHDMSARRDTMNCCLFNVKDVLTPDQLPLGSHAQAPSFRSGPRRSDPRTRRVRSPGRPCVALWPYLPHRNA